MKSLLNFTDRLRIELENNPLINTVSIGDVTEVDLDKASIFPLAHLNISTGTIGSATSTLNVQIMFLDVVDETQEPKTDNWYRNSNEIYVQNSMLAAATKATQEMLRGDLYRDLFQVEEQVTAEFVSERFQNMLSGVVIDLTVTINNNIDLTNVHYV